VPTKRRRQLMDGVPVPQQETSLLTEEVWRGAEARLRAGTARREATKRRIETGQYQALDTPARLHARVNRVLGDPIARQELREKGLVESRGPDGDLNEFLLERIINGENFLGVNFFDLGKRAARCVGRIEIRTPDGRGGSGTGAMVSPWLLLTNHHVLQTADWARQSHVVFDHEDDINGNPRQTVTFEFNPEAFFLTDAALDFTLVAVEESSLQPQGGRLSDYGFNPLDPAQGKIMNGECINIIQHPRGMHKQVILQDNQLLDLREDSPWLHYEADTLPGSSGAPLFNNRWEMIGVHHAGWPRRDGEGRILTKDGRIWTRQMSELAIDWLGNEGARISRIVAAASAAYPSLPSAQQALLDDLFTPPKRGTVVAPTGPRSPTPHAFDSWRGDRPVMPAAQIPIPQASGLDTKLTDQQAQPTETRTATMPATSVGGEIRMTIPLHVTVRLGTPTIDSRQTTPLPPCAAPVPLGRPSRLPGMSIQPGSGYAPPTPLRAQPGIVFEGFAMQVSRGRDQHTVQQAVSTVLGPRWTIQLFGDHPTDFEVTKGKGALTVDAAWEATYRLRAQPGVVYAEPLFAVTLGRTQDWQDTPAPPRVDSTTGRPVAEEVVIAGLCTESEPLPESHDIEWSLKQVRVFQAWVRFFPDPSSQPGAGIVIGHPDTGYRRHPEIVDNLLIDRGYDFVDDDPDAEDELEDGPLLNPGHGTQTASVIISPKGPPAGSVSAQAVTGVAPGAQLIPIRTGRSVITLISSFNLAHAIEHAADQGAHVTSISRGAYSTGVSGRRSCMPRSEASLPWPLRETASALSCGLQLMMKWLRWRPATPDVRSGEGLPMAALSM
jgi:V8-like Glu-specific endopeptidase